MGIDFTSIPVFLFFENYKFTYKIVRNNYHDTRHYLRPKIGGKYQDKLKRNVIQSTK